MSSHDALEWDLFLDWALQHTRSVPGRILLERYRNPEDWAHTVEVCNILQTETSEISSLLGKPALWEPLNELADPDPVLERLEKSAVLEIQELVFLRRWLYAIDSWVQIPREEIASEHLRSVITKLTDPYESLRILDRILTPTGELSEKATPTLQALFSEIRNIKRAIGVVLDQLIRSLSQKNFLQDQFSDLRDGRYVIPVKINCQSEVAGNLYEASVSKQTVFIEPAQVTPLNNRLRQKQNELIQEIYALLKETSLKLQPFRDEIKQSVSILAHWDAVQARARVALHYSGRNLQITASRHFRLKQTAHPLLWKTLRPEQIIRNDIEFGVESNPPQQTFLITGPNTGGKTVLLKTLGLASICARTGFPFPGTHPLVVPFFETVFADLGDPQSLENKISSFSGHLLRFKETLDHATPNSLVLFDELNSATDPKEGAALGRAILETLMQKGTLIVATTHDPHLKIYALNDPRIVNASMAFDEHLRTPTFHLVLGIPGLSRALETAERLGISSSVIALAKNFLSKEHQEFETLLSKLQTESQETSRAKREAQHLLEEAQRLKNEWTSKTQASVNDLLEKTRLKLRRVLEQAQDEVRAHVRKLDEARSRKDLDKSRGELNEAFSVAASRIESAFKEEAPEIAAELPHPLPEPARHLPQKFVQGMFVRVPKWKSTGTVLEVAGDKIKVALGNLQMTLSASDIDSLTETESKELRQQQERRLFRQHPSGYSTEEVPTPSAEIDLRGLRLEEAMSQLAHYLDQAFRSGARKEVTVVHGLGTGTIREGARKLIQSLPYVKSYRDAGVGMGGAGATLIEFELE